MGAKDTKFSLALLDAVIIWDSGLPVVAPVPTTDLRAAETLPLDPEPWVSHHGRHDEPDPTGWDFDVEFTWSPRPGYEQPRERYKEGAE